MLKALELCGFKSFADKTRFEFPPGITVVVGPNGSGKSNIVDGIKWVLGEQSVKSLRGREMADVIFKGSGGSGTRRPSNTAEATIFFENAERLLPIDSDEVRVTRRVYRSGEAEYLLNGDPCRLRDVKDLFRGTGVGTDAYSLIEQGKVDTLLQASARERRAIFEEAAGISRFKAKKVETQRRLERVDQNLTRLADIVDEVESRLRSVRNQASKARRYKEYTDRLQQLRTFVGMTDWRRFSGQLADSDQRLGQTERELESTVEALRTAEAEQQSVDQLALQMGEQLHEAETDVSNVRQHLAGHESTVVHERQRLADVEHEITRFRRQWLSMTARAGDLGAQLDEIQRDLQHAEQTDTEIRARLETHQFRFARASKQLLELREQREVRAADHARLLQESAGHGRQISALDSEIRAAAEAMDRNRGHESELRKKRDSAQAQSEALQASEQQLDQQERRARDTLNAARRSLHSSERQLTSLQQEFTDLQRRHAVAGERASVLQDLQRRHEGLSSGVKDVLSQASDEAVGPLASVRGLVADLIRVDVGMAPLIDVALGELTQFVVVDGDSLIQSVARGEFPLKGRIGLLDLSGPFPDVSATVANLTDQRSVIGRADRFVEVDPGYQALVGHLLSSTWCVETLADVLRLRETVGNAARFVTRIGELVESDGRLSAGPRQSGTGLVLRRSELRSLQHEIVQLEQTMELTESKIVRLKNDIDSAEREVDSEAARYDQAASDLTEARLQTRSAQERLASLAGQLATLETEIGEAKEKQQSAETRHAAKSNELEQVTERIAAVEAATSTHQQQMVDLETESEVHAESVTSVKVELAKSEQRLDDLRGQHLRSEEDQKERVRAIGELRTQLHEASVRRDQATNELLVATSAIADLSLQFEDRQRQIRGLTLARNESHARREVILTQTRGLRKTQHQLEEQRHGLQLDANRIRLERDGLAERVRDDYGIELAEIEDLPPEEEEQQREREEIEQEIGSLRRKISNVGAVNMAALEEIDALETRHNSLAGQYQDLHDAKESLARIIHKINADSRRLFTESLEIIRENFQGLFRRVFGGGHADIVLDEDADVLEAGIDIVATPPGKQSLNLSLLSGGERALTAVTLLLAIFQYRPSPFCVLDEVDGPLDEANIGRFIDVLNEFLEWTKFVVVTHSKKTMTAATTLYGVTMEESGVSKRVSVQFEDVTEDGHIRREALSRDATDPDESTPDDDERGAA